MELDKKVTCYVAAMLFSRKLAVGANAVLVFAIISSISIFVFQYFYICLYLNKMKSRIWEPSFIHTNTKNKHKQEFVLVSTKVCVHTQKYFIKV